MKKFITCLFVLLMVYSSEAQKIIGGKLTWLLSSGNGDSRLSYTLKSTGLIGGTGSYGYTGVESVELLLRNNISHKLIVTVSYTLINTCNESQTFQKKETLAPNETTDSKGAFNTGVDYETTCKEFRKIGDQNTVIKNVNIELISIEDITEKEAIATRRSEEEAVAKRRAAAERKAQEEQVQVAQQRQLALKEASSKPTTANTSTVNTGGSYYGNQSSSNTPRKPTWEETNARIKAEQLQEYNDQRARIAESQRRSKELDDQISSGITELAGMVGNIIQQGREERERKEAKRERAAQEVQQARFAEENRIKERARQKALQLELRNSLFSEFTDGVIPLSSQRVGVRQLFYFTYAYDKNSLEGTAPSIFLSNIFSIAQYADDTWPFKTGVINEMRKLQSKTTIVLIGYFTLKSEAEETRNRFKDLANRSDFSLQDFTYNGKKVESKSSSDFWENDNKQTEGNAGKAKLIIARGDEDFWETGQQKKKMVAETKKEEPKKKIEESKKKTVNKDDFWNN